MSRLFLLVLLGLFLGACSREVYVKSAEYGTLFKLVETEYGTFRVYEHPTKKSLAVSSTLAAAAGAGIVKGLTLGTANIIQSEIVFEEAARKYLDGTVLINCKITRGYLLQSPVYEFQYECPKAEKDA